MSVAFRAGSMDCRVIEDGEGFLPVEGLFAGAPADDRAVAASGRFDGGGIVVPYGCLLVRSEDVVVLVDAGIGPYEHPLGGRGGDLERALGAEGVAPGDVDLVVITHGHLDHIGGLCVGGRPRFAAARHVMSREEWEWSTQRESQVADEQLPPLDRAGVLELVDDAAEPIPGIRVLPAPGHTPGHLAVEIGGSEGAIYVADAIVDELHAEHPEWTMSFDEDPPLAVQTRIRLLRRAADQGLVLAASHLRIAGHVRRTADGFHMRP